jgi:membrane-bound lytic murein transglycosylase F
MALAKKYGKNPHIWFNHVETYLLKKNDPDYYRDPVVKYGFFRGAETVRYVQNVLDTYEKYLKKNKPFFHSFSLLIPLFYNDFL